MYLLDLQMLKSAKCYLLIIIAVEARQGAYDYAKIYDVGLMNLFYSSTNIAYNTHNQILLRTKYDYIFKIKILEFYFGIPLIKKLIYYVKKKFIS
jgi:hypothetical protein